MQTDANYNYKYNRSGNGSADQSKIK